MKTLSIIVTTLNSNIKIKNFLESISNQDTQDFSLIIVDGGSTDSTIETIKNFKFPINFILKPGISIYGGINCALDACKSDYYLVCGSDDELYYNAVSTVLLDINQHPEFDLYLYSINKGNSVCKSKKPSKIRKFLGWQTIISSHSVGTVISKALHQEFDFYSLEYPILADGHFFSKVFNTNKNIYISNKTIGNFSLDGLSNKNIYNNIFTTFTIQIESYSFFPQLLLLIYRLIKYRKSKFNIYHPI
jgi:glycosyltransferase involved in cell wall biosynthesis